MWPLGRVFGDPFGSAVDGLFWSRLLIELIDMPMAVRAVACVDQPWDIEPISAATKKRDAPSPPPKTTALAMMIPKVGCLLDERGR